MTPAKNPHQINFNPMTDTLTGTVCNERLKSEDITMITMNLAQASGETIATKELRLKQLYMEERCPECEVKSTATQNYLSMGFETRTTRINRIGKDRVISV